MALSTAWLLPLFLAASVLYTSVGHGGATAYLAILTLAGYGVKSLQTTVLVLNVLAASVAFVHFRHAGHLKPRLFALLIVTSVPAAYLGGLTPFSDRAAALLLGIVLGVAALRLLLVPKPPNLGIREEGVALFVGAPLLGAVLGYVAGATSIGGGIFLSPILLLLGWCDVKQAGAIASAFIVLNSAAGLAAKVHATPIDVTALAWLSGAVVLGALVGAFLGARKLPARGTQVALGLVLLVASAKSLLG